MEALYKSTTFLLSPLYFKNPVSIPLLLAGQVSFSFSSRYLEYHWAHQLTARQAAVSSFVSCGGRRACSDDGSACVVADFDLRSTCIFQPCKDTRGLPCLRRRTFHSCMLSDLLFKFDSKKGNQLKNQFMSAISVPSKMQSLWQYLKWYWQY